MSAANSASTADQKPREPSMEEILASIRRIIADDQSLPRHVIMSEPPPSTAEAAPLPPAPEARLPEPEPVVPPYESEAYDAPVDEQTHVAPFGVEEHEMDSRRVHEDATHRHGAIAPQFPTPHGTSGGYAGASFDPHADHAPTQTREDDGPPSDMPAALRDSYEAASHIMSPEPVPPDDAAPSTDVPQSPTYADPPEQTPMYETPLAHDREHHGEEPAALFSPETDTAVASAFNMLAATRLADNSDELKSMVREMIRPLLRSWLDDNLPGMVERMVRAEIERVARGGR